MVRISDNITKIYTKNKKSNRHSVTTRVFFSNEIYNVGAVSDFKMCVSAQFHYNVLHLGDFR